LLLLHGGLFHLDLQFGPLLPGLAADGRSSPRTSRGQGRTNDLDRPLTSSDLAST
jgi:hypothetical protein